MIGVMWRLTVAIWVGLMIGLSTLLRRRDRGDVPGWVLITVMTAGLVTALWLIAGPELQAMFRRALAGVRGP